MSLLENDKDKTIVQIALRLTLMSSNSAVSLRFTPYENTKTNTRSLATHIVFLLHVTINLNDKYSCIFLRDVTIPIPFGIRVIGIGVGALGICNFLRKIRLENFEQLMIDSGFSTQETFIKLHKISLLSKNSLFLMTKFNFIFLKKLPIKIPIPIPPMPIPYWYCCISNLS